MLGPTAATSLLGLGALLVGGRVVLRRIFEVSAADEQYINRSTPVLHTILALQRLYHMHERNWELCSKSAS
jgi:hypothetical protein